MNWRLASRLSVVTLAVLVVLLVLLLRTHVTGSSPSNQSTLQGTDLGSTPAPNFRLTDQLGRHVSLSEFKGQPVILTFLYTHCPDVCPLTAEKLHIVMGNLGRNAQHITVLAVSTDPTNDTPHAVLDFSQSHHMQDYWHFLIGTHTTLAPVWSAYHIYVVPTSTAKGSMIMNHSRAIYLIDQQGNERAFFNDDFTPGQLTSDVNMLLRG